MFATVATAATPVRVGALTEVAVIPFVVKLPEASLATIVDAPLDAEAVVALLGILVNAAPEPLNAPENVVVVSVFVLGLKLNPISVLNAWFPVALFTKVR